MGTGGAQHSLVFAYNSTDFDLFQDIIAEDPETHGAMQVPVIGGSDKTTVSVATGQNDFYPFYASAGNLHNHVRRAHRDGVALVGFLNVPKSAYIPMICQ